MTLPPYPLHGPLRKTEVGVFVEPHLVGQFNVSNLLAVIGTLMASGFSLEEAATVAEDLAPAGGDADPRRVGDPLVVVDYAHSPDALEQVLTAIRATVGPATVAWSACSGCGGDRDPGKRPLMGEWPAAWPTRSC